MIATTATRKATETTMPSVVKNDLSALARSCASATWMTSALRIVRQRSARANRVTRTCAGAWPLLGRFGGLRALAGRRLRRRLRGGLGGRLPGGRDRHACGQRRAGPASRHARHQRLLDGIAAERPSGASTAFVVGDDACRRQRPCARLEGDCRALHDVAELVGDTR